MDFSNRPPAESLGHSLRLVRTPTHGILRAVITSHDLVGTPTHWYHGRTLPCGKTDCAACRSGVPWRWHGWLGAILAGAHEHILFEMTDKATPPLTEYHDVHGTLRGCGIVAQRAAPRTNGRVLIECSPIDQQKIKLPAAPNVIKALSQIWNVPILKTAPGSFVPERNAHALNLFGGDGNDAA